MTFCYSYILLAKYMNNETIIGSHSSRIRLKNLLECGYLHLFLLNIKIIEDLMHLHTENTDFTTYRRMKNIVENTRALYSCTRAGYSALGFNGWYLAGASIFAAGSNDVVDNIEHFKTPINLWWWSAETCNPFRAVYVGIQCNTSRIHGETRVYSSRPGVII